MADDLGPAAVVAAEEARIRAFVDFDQNRDQCIGEINGMRRALRLLTTAGLIATPECEPTVSAEAGVDLIAAERRRQINVEGYTPEHDAHHYDPDVLARAGATYALPDGLRGDIPGLWPWGVPAWKPTPNDRVRELVKAGALIAAAIDAEVRRG